MTAIGIGILISFLMPCFLGMVVSVYLWPAESRGDLLTRACLSLGLGIGLSSIFSFGWLLAFNADFGGLTLIQYILLFSLLALFSYALKTGKVSFKLQRRDTGEAVPKYRVYLAAAFILSLTLFLLSFILLSLREPHRGWDAWAI